MPPAAVDRPGRIVIFKERQRSTTWPTPVGLLTAPNPGQWDILGVVRKSAMEDCTTSLRVIGRIFVTPNIIERSEYRLLSVHVVKICWGPLRCKDSRAYSTIREVDCNETPPPSSGRLAFRPHGLHSTCRIVYSAA